ncbi:hypothetical protein QR98_0064790 [Sarcoptes scabiei]|uniref:Uncharacterized protein n=1 Tax=Sarcoptes scabiei TaxID=52283 RepID=A0A132AAF0_SARSC|nr:hypothetical protein QR98_0064790 [Sarcoptes scabiei]
MKLVGSLLDKIDDDDGNDEIGARLEIDNDFDVRDEDKGSNDDDDDDGENDDEVGDEVGEVL